MCQFCGNELKMAGGRWNNNNNAFAIVYKCETCNMYGHVDKFVNAKKK
jgi:hypothetical protein